MEEVSRLCSWWLSVACCEQTRRSLPPLAPGLAWWRTGNQLKIQAQGVSDRENGSQPGARDFLQIGGNGLRLIRGFERLEEPEHNVQTEAGKLGDSVIAYIQLLPASDDSRTEALHRRTHARHYYEFRVGIIARFMPAFLLLVLAHGLSG